MVFMDTYKNEPLYSLWVGNDFKVSQSILLTTTSCECLNLPQNTRIAMILFMVPVTLPNTGFCAFNSLSADTLGFRVAVSVGC